MDTNKTIGKIVGCFTLSFWALVYCFGQNHNPEFEVLNLMVDGDAYIVIGEDDAVPMVPRTEVELRYRDNDVQSSGTTTLNWISPSRSAPATPVLAYDAEDTLLEFRGSLKGPWTWEAGDQINYQGDKVYFQGEAGTDIFVTPSVVLEASHSGQQATFRKKFQLITGKLDSEVRITTPIDGYTDWENEVIILSATASDVESGIDRIEFYYLDESNVEQLINISDTPSDDGSGPYIVGWQLPSFATGTGITTLTVTAKAFDSLGNQAASPPITIIVREDSDRDYMQDDWEIYHFGSLNQLPTGDADGDGATNRFEHDSGTDASNAVYDGEYGSIDTPPDLMVDIEMASPVNGLSVVEGTSLILSAVVGESNRPITKVEFNYLDDASVLIGVDFTTGSEDVFKTIWVSVPSDGSLVTDQVITATAVDHYGYRVVSDPIFIQVSFDEDKDEDGMIDAWEARYVSLNPLEDDAALNADTDTFTNLDEYRLSINPELHEINPEIDNADIDSDAIPDEIEAIYDALDPTDSSDTLEDYDGDRYPNIFEVYFGTDPDDGASYPSFADGNQAYFQVDSSLSESIGNSYTNIVDAVNAADAYNFSIIEVLPGEYVGKISVSAPMLILSSGGAAQTVIRSGNSNDEAVFALSSVVLNGLTLSDSQQGLVLDLNSSGEAVIVDCVIRDNGFESPATHGGGISLTGGIASIVGCKFESNQSYAQGAAIYLSDATVDIDRSIVRGNGFIYGRGSIYQDGGEVDLRSTVVMDNRSSEKGGAFYLTGSSQTDLEHCTIAGNVAALDASALYLDSVTSMVTVTNSIFWNPVVSVSEFGAVDYSYLASSLVFDHSLVRDGVVDLVNHSVVSASDPLITRDGHLQSSSPAIDLGVTSFAIYDIDGEAYPVSDRDLGADEYIDIDFPSDGLPDWFENAYGVSDSAGDNDSDSLSNLDEYLAGGNPVANLDVDYDSLPDDWELSTWILGIGGLDPRSNRNPDGQFDDFDGDGASNYFEYTQGTNPNDASSFALNVPSTVTFEGPKDQAFVFADGSVTLSVAASDIDNSIDRVEFFADSILIGSDSTPEVGDRYTFDWSDLSVDVDSPYDNRRFTLEAIAVDSYGHRVPSEVKDFGLITRKESQLLSSAFAFGDISLWLRPFEGIAFEGVSNSTLDTPEFVNSWRDQSVSALVFTQSIASDQPRVNVDFVFESSTVDSAYLRESVSFDGADDVLVSSVSTLTETDTDIVVCIAWQATEAHDGVIWSQDGMSLATDVSGFYYFEYQGFRTDAFRYRPDSADPENSFQVVSIVEVENAGSSEGMIRLHHNGFAINTHSLNLPSVATSNLVTLGDSGTTPGQFFNGHVWEVLVSSGGLPLNEQLAAIFAYFRDTYQLNMLPPESSETLVPKISIESEDSQVAYLYAGQPFDLSALGSTGNITDFEWDIDDDGSVDYTDPVATISFETPEVYQVRLTVSDVYGQTREIIQAIRVRELPGAAMVVHSTGCGLAGSDFIFDASSSQGEDISYTWDFGNGQFATGPIANHQYSTAGSYDVTLIVDAPNFVGESVIVSTVVVEPLPNVALSILPLNPEVSQTLNCSIGEWSCADAIYTWDFGDGHVVSGATVAHVYQIAGDYTVTTTVSSGGVNLVSIKTEVSVSEVVDPIDADFSSSAASGAEINIPVVFNASASTGSIGLYEWDFGDGSAIVSGSASTHKSVSHAYSEPGIYTVALTVYDALSSNDSDTITSDVTVRVPALTFTNEILQWVDANHGLPLSGSTVDLWQDRSGALLDFTQAVASYRPLNNENSSSAAQSSNHLAFDGIDDFMTSGPVLKPDVVEQSLILVWSAIESRNGVLWSQGDLELYTFTNSQGSPGYGIMIDGSTILLEHTYSVGEDVVSVVGFTQNSDGTYLLSLYHNGAFVDSSLLTSLVIDGAALTHLGRRSDLLSPDYFLGEIRCVLVADRVPGAAQNHELLVYLVHSYGLTLAADLDTDSLPDWWEELYADGDLIKLGGPQADYDGDGIDDVDEYQLGSDPIDFFNGQLESHTITVVNTNIPRGASGILASPAFVLEVRNEQGSLVKNAPITLTPQMLSALLTTDMGGAGLVQPLTVRTDDDGIATIYIQP